ncbi:hypothetical protein BS47DRAFT_1367528 [Hydnum rufescens UP504]|uniref:Uncharacterized protein n=1 Tax=Hydnum rufescens UP504 TaxID=1448309 RepID=A0A9P6AI73_9AGAM|nr:hypothetical protein BS47DRAFT_1367528 [Hydnum rufescens UP504]
MRHIQEIGVIRVEGDRWGFDMRASTADGVIVVAVTIRVFNPGCRWDSLQALPALLYYRQSAGMMPASLRRWSSLAQHSGYSGGKEYARERKGSTYFGEGLEPFLRHAEENSIPVFALVHINSSTNLRAPAVASAIEDCFVPEKRDDKRNTAGFLAMEGRGIKMMGRSPLDSVIVQHYWLKSFVHSTSLDDARRLSRTYGSEREPLMHTEHQRQNFHIASTVMLNAKEQDAIRTRCNPFREDQRLSPITKDATKEAKASTKRDHGEDRIRLMEKRRRES